MSDKELEELLEQRDEIDRRVASRQIDMAVLFTDIVGSTELFERRGDVEGVAFIHRHNRLLFPVVEESGGRIVKTIGDAIMAVFDNPEAAVLCGAMMQRRLAETRTAETGEAPIHIKVGIHFGKVVPAGEDVFGDAVNTAARIQGKAIKDEVLISESLRARVAETTGMSVVPRGAVPLKGKAKPLPVVSLLWGPQAPAGVEHSSADERTGRSEVLERVGLGARQDSRVLTGAPMPDLFVLEIARSAAGLRVAALDGPRDKGPVKSYAEVSLDTSDLEAVAGRMAAFLGGDAGSYADRMTDAGRELFDSALSERVRARLRETTCSYLRLHVEDSLAHVPWELLNDGKSYLCLQFATGRVVAALDDGQEKSDSLPGTRGSHALVVSNPTGDLPRSAREGEAVAGLFGDGFSGEVRHLEGPVSRQELLEALRGARFFHFAGHVGRGEDPSGYGFRLIDGCLSPEETARHLDGAATDLVFANACHAHHARGWTDAARGTYDLASTLLMRGVRHYLGPIGMIDDADALSFALRFYEEVLAGVAFGEAARRAREFLVKKSTSPLAFARYVLYGEPRTILPKEVATLPARGSTRADPKVPPSDALSDGARFPPPGDTLAGSAAASSRSGDRLSVSAVSGKRRRRVLVATLAALGLVTGVTLFVKGFFDESQTVASVDEADAPRTGDIRMAVLDLTPMGDDIDPNLTGRIRNTLNFALVGIPGFAVMERTNIHQMLGTEVGEGELRLQAESKILDQVAFDVTESAAIGRLRGVEVAVVGGYQEAAGRLLIIANFVDVETGTVIEAVRVEGPAGEEHVFVIQDDLSQRVKEALPRIQERLRP